MNREDQNWLNMVFSLKTQKIVVAVRILFYALKQSSLQCEYRSGVFGCILFLKILSRFSSRYGFF